LRAESPSRPSETWLGVGAAPDSSPPSPDTLLPGEVVGGAYEIRRTIGSGGMGVVYEAHDRLLNRSVAIKVAYAGGGEFSLREEGQALAAMRHPSLVAVYALGVHRGMEYLVMELIPGKTLEEHLAKARRTGEPRTLAEMLDILIGVAEGLSAVHAAGVSHRDVKPSNIMLAPGNRIVLMDLGLFCPAFTLAARLAGTPEYLAPELISGRAEPGQGHLVDLYAFGVLCYQLVVGQLPYRGRDPVETCGRHLRDPIPNLAAVRADVPRELARLVGNLLAKDPRERAQNIEPVLWELRAIRSRLDGRGLPRFSVLIVDDDCDVLLTLRSLVKATIHDAKVRTARNGQAALAAVQKELPRVILLDLNLPDINGLEICMYLCGAQLMERCQIITISAFARPSDVRLLRQLGVLRFIPKGAAFPGELAAALTQMHRLG
jgi:eukaryotic-like serine/threonine-protein kinase